MEVLNKLKTVVTCGFRSYIRPNHPLRFFSSNVDKTEGDKKDDGSNESALPFSRNGDDGTTVVNSVTLLKDDQLFHAIGNTDELMCHLGVARENAIKNKHPYIDKLTRIQTMLVDIVLVISKQTNKEIFPVQNTKELEEWIVKYSKELTPAENYLLPGGGKVATSMHVARSVCRRAERTVLPLVREGQLDKEVLVYFNRLADLLFTWARYAAKRDERSESVYTPKSESKKKLKQEIKDSNNNPSSGNK